MDSQFISRYDRTPSTLTICRGYCEGMGEHPQRTMEYVQKRQQQIRKHMEGEFKRTREYPNETNCPSPVDADAWEFVTCARCNGTGKCSRMETLRRVPKWFWHCTVFVFTGPARGRRNDLLDYWFRFKATFLADLGMA